MNSETPGPPWPMQAGQKQVHINKFCYTFEVIFYSAP